jgi:transcriptional regulator with XRE-family HTH domain
MTLEGLAEAAGVSASYLSEVERRLKRPSTDVVAKIAGAFGMLPSSFLEYVESLPPTVVADALGRMESPRIRMAFSQSAVAPALPPQSPRPSDRTLRLLMSHARQLEEADLRTLVDIARRLIKREKKS